MIDPSRFGPWVSPEAVGHFLTETWPSPPSSEIADLRRHYDEFNERYLAHALATDPVRISERTIAGVPVHAVEPIDGIRDSRRLICLHGGAFMWGSGAGALLEAVPVAAATGMEVLAVDYRLAPEQGFPAAVDDVLAVYMQIVTELDSQAVGIYGCSAGAILAAQTVARLLHEKVPGPGAIAMLHGAGVDFAGDSAQFTPALQAAPAADEAPSFQSLPYFSGVDPNDLLALPGNYPDVLGRFPPSLLVTASRDFAASSVWTMHRRLLAAGVEAECITFDGLWHAHHMATALPESRETFAHLARFFGVHLKQR
jgi:monoterpene epsilon-lactone hydrolase